MTIYNPRKPKARRKEAQPIISSVYNAMNSPSAMNARILLDGVRGKGYIRNQLK
jgi:hypothetical protein